MSDDQGHYEIVLPFDTDSPEFARGFELGQIYERLSCARQRGQPIELQRTIHSENVEMIMRIAGHFELDFTGEHIEGYDEWLHLRLVDRG